MPSQLAAELGNWSPIAFVIAGFASLLIALCFAEVGSRFDSTGGPYLYTRAAFGSFAAFEVGWMFWFTRTSSQAAIVNGIAVALAFYWLGMKEGVARACLIVALTALLAAIHTRGIKQSAWAVNAFTIGKLLPLAVLIAAGIFFVDPSKLLPLPALTSEQAATGGLLLIFTFGGFDVISIPAGETRNPRRHLPMAFMATMAVVTAVMTLVQIVAMTTLDDLTKSSAPLSDAALTIMGPFGAALLGLGAVISMTGNNLGGSLAASRMLYAFGADNALPAVFGRIHARYRTPVFAIWFTAAVVIVLALSGSFAVLATASAMARLLMYLGVCTATMVLRKPAYANLVRPAAYTIPLGPVIPVGATLISLAMLAGASTPQLIGGAAALAAGAALYGLNRLLTAKAHRR